MPQSFTETLHTGEFVLSLLPGYQSRENIVVAAGANLVPGTVLGKVTASGKYVAHAPAAADGSQNAAAIVLTDAPAATADARVAAIVRGAEVNGNLLVWNGSITAPQKTTAVNALAALGILVRM